MAKFHINNEGEPRACRAKNGNCPYSLSEEHFSSKEEARANYEALMARQGRQTTFKEAVKAYEEEFKALDASAVHAISKLGGEQTFTGKEVKDHWSKAQYLFRAYYVKGATYEDRRSYAYMISDHLRRISLNTLGMKPASMEPRFKALSEKFGVEAGPTPLY